MKVVYEHNFYYYDIERWQVTKRTKYLDTTFFTHAEM